VFRHYIALVGKVVRIAGTLRDEPEGLSLHDLAMRTGYVKSSVHRILQSLGRHGYIDKDATGYVHPYHGEFTLIEDTNQRIFLTKEG